PQNKSFIKALRVVNNIITAHNLTAPQVKAQTGKPVSVAFHLSDLQPSGPLGGLVRSLSHYLANEYILRRTVKTCDFIGINYYEHFHIGVFGKRITSSTGHEFTDLNWSIHPEGLERVLLNLKKYNKPIYITENGLADEQDLKREKFIKDHLFFIHRAIKQGVDVRGYLYWSLTDNFEWQHGFWPRFGLVEIDRENSLKRKVRYSALKYAEICKENLLEYEIK
ncbi:MAG: family 1 glycosylhydrolase, partial [Patescibacteria group bacterium]